MNATRKNFKKLFISQSLKTCSDFYRTSRFRIFSNNMKKAKIKNTILTSFLKNNHKNISNKFFDSFHKSFIRRKLSSNPKYIEIEKQICYTERNLKPKNHNKNNNYQNNFEKIFLTNNNDSINYKKRMTNNSLKKLISIDKHRNIKNNYFHNIHSNIFLSLNENKFRNNNYPDVLCPKISDFIDDIKLIRKVKFVNNIKIEQHKQVSNLVGLKVETIDLTIHSLTHSIKLLNSYNSSFSNYNKFLINEIKKEKQILDNYIVDENIIKEQVILLEKKFDDLMIEFEILNNFNSLFKAVKERARINNNDLLSKTFAEKTIETLKKKIVLKKKNTVSLNSPKRLLLKKTTMIQNKSNENETSINNITSNKIITKFDKKNTLNIRKHQPILEIKSNTISIEQKKKIDRLNSFQPSAISQKKNIDNYNFNQNNNTNIQTSKIQFNNYDIHKEFKIILDNILDLIEKYNDNECYIISFKLLFDKEANSINALKLNQQIKEKINILDYSRKYNILLISKLKLLKCQKNDYSLFIFIYNKLNQNIDLIKDYKVKKYQHLIDQFVDVYDKNTIINQYNFENNRKNYKREYLEKELINYLYKVLALFEKLECGLIEGKNNYLKNNYFSERIEEYENKMDNAKKLFNNRFKRDEDKLRRKKINEKTIKKWNKILFKPIRKVVENHQMLSSSQKKKIKNEENVNEIENLLFY